MGRSSHFGPAWVAGFAIVALTWTSVAAQAASMSSPDSSFAARLEAALVSGPQAQDGLWLPEARSVAARSLDLRAAALFSWSEVKVRPLRAERIDATEREVEVELRGLASWQPVAYEVAKHFWTPMSDEELATNRVVRREVWTLRSVDGEWLAVDRREGALVDVLRADVVASVYPGQESMLLDCTYYVRSRVEGLERLRFLLDRRAQVYGAAAEGQRMKVTRGSELPSLGLLGFTGAVESSMALPKALGAGEESLWRFRVITPLVHLEEDGFVTTLPVSEGVFQERAWLPLVPHLAPADLNLTLRWPEGAFAEAALSADSPKFDTLGDGAATSEERGFRARCRGPLRSLDFVLVPSDRSLEQVDEHLLLEAADFTSPWKAEGVFEGVALHSFRRAADSDAFFRTRSAFLTPLLTASTSSTSDLSSELQEVLPLDEELLDFLDDFADDGADDAEQGSDDRAQGEG